jgi:hypothetical protein
MMRRLRLGNLRKLFRDRYGPTLPDDDAGREDLIELLLPISVGPNATTKMPNAIEVWAPWMQQKEAEAIIDQINLMPIWQRKPTAGVLGERLRVTNGERERLKLWTIAPCDMGQSGMLWWRKYKDRERKRRLRQLRDQQSRAAYLAYHTASKQQPWIVLGIGRRTWYYRTKQTNCTSPSEVKLLTTADQPVQPQRRQVSKKKRSAERRPSIIESEPTPQAEKPESPVKDTVGAVPAREISGPTCAISEQAAAFGLLPEQYLLTLKSWGDLRGMPQDITDDLAA